MSIVNIIDRRKRPYRFYTVNAIIEAAWHDNSCKDSDQIDDIRGPDYDEKEGIQLHEAVSWANGIDAPVTLYIYDEDGGTCEARGIERASPVQPRSAKGE